MNKQNQIFILLTIVISITVIHRVIVFYDSLYELNNLIAENPNWLTWQYLHIDAYITSLFKSLLYLQQTPPIPSFILGIFAKIFGWPYGTTYALIIFQGILSILTVFMLFFFLNVITKRSVLSAFLSVAFCLSPDLIVMEYNSFGQTFYEHLAMLLVLVVVYFFYRIIEKEKIIDAVGLGITTGALALTRASFSYFFIVPATFLVLIIILKRFFNHTRTHVSSLLVVYFLAVLFTQGIWIGKNYFIYENFSLSTSSWQGLNFSIGFAKRGNEKILIQSILSEKDRYPDWFVQMTGNHGLVHWQYPTFKSYIPDQFHRQDKQIQIALNNKNSTRNSIGQRIISDLYMQAATSLILKNPQLAVTNFIRGYKLFWQPIKNYSNKFLGPLYVKPTVNNSFDFVNLIKVSFNEGICGNQYLMKGTIRNKSNIATCFYTIPYLPLIILLINIITIHIITPFVTFLLLFRLLLNKNSSSNYNKLLSFYIFFLFLLGIYLYSVVVMNLAEYGENMRFRLAIEPLIWLLSFYSITIFLQLFSPLIKFFPSSIALNYVLLDKNYTLRGYKLYFFIIILITIVPVLLNIRPQHHIPYQVLTQIIANKNSIIKNEWLGADYYSIATGKNTLPNFKVIGSFKNTGNESGELILRLKRGDKVWFRSEPRSKKQRIVIDGVANKFTQNLNALPPTSKWILLEFSNSDLPNEFDVKFVDGGGGWGEWSAVGLNDK